MASAAAFSHPGVRWIAGGWAAFIAENLVLSHNRDSLVTQFGESRYQQAYSLLSTVSCAAIAFGYLRHGRAQGPTLWATPRLPLRCGAFALQTAGFLMLSQVFPALQVPFQITGSAPAAQAEPAKPQTIPQASGPSVRALCPVDFKFDKTHRSEDGIWGMQRVSRHPTLWAFGLTGLGTALGTPFATEFVMFATPLLFAAVGSAHQDYRYRRGSGGLLSPETEAKTSNVPFVAMIQGRQSASSFLLETKGLNAALAVLLGVGLAISRARRGR
jgi:prenyl protein peptidase